MVLQTRPNVLHAIVGTAGHVDHGKTALVRALTGVDTDRLPEEKARGMSIDLGFAPFALSDGSVVGIVDVPGHRDYVRNMVAGAASIDVLLLVIAADDGVMPQTEEHLRIVRLLRSPPVMAAITKVDRVGPARADAVQREVTAFLTAMGCENAPIAWVSSITGEGIVAVRTCIERLVRRAIERTAHPQGSGRPFRMNVEHVFSKKGHGTIVTGVPIAGDVSADDTLELLPGGTRTGIRRIQTYRLDAERASAHVCAAVNLRDVGTQQVRRGMTLTTPGAYEAVNTFVSTITNASCATVVRRRETFRLHAGTSATVATVRLVGLDELMPGGEALALVKLAEPMVLATGDRFIVRPLDGSGTIGGGSVLGTRAGRAKTHAPIVLERLNEARARLMDGDVFGAAWLVASEAIISHRNMVRLTQCTGEAAEAVLERERANGRLVRVGDTWIVRARLGELVTRVKALLRAHHDKNPWSWGLGGAKGAEALHVSGKDFGMLGEHLASADPDIVVRCHHLALRDHAPALDDAQRLAKAHIAQVVTAAGANPPARGDLTRDAATSSSAMRHLLRLLVEEEVVTVLRAHVVSTPVYRTCRAALLALFEQHAVVDINRFREATGLSRRVAVDILEAFDAERLTRRVPEGRVLVARCAER